MLILKLEILKFLSIKNKETKKHDFIESNLVNDISLIFKKPFKPRFSEISKIRLI